MKLDSVRVLPDLLDLAADEHGERWAFSQTARQSETHLSYEDLRAQAYRGAGYLVDRQSEGRELVLLLMESCPQWAASFFAILLAGRIVIPVPSNTPIENLQVVIHVAGVERMVVGPVTQSQGDALLAAGAAIEVISAERLFGAGVDRGLPHISPDDTALLAFTSGSTQMPRAVEVTHLNLISDLRSVLEVHHVDSDAVFLSMLPPAHLFELVVGMLGPLVCGAEIVQPTSLLPNRILATIKHKGVTHCLAVPALLDMLEKEIIEELADVGIVSAERRHQSLAEIVEVVRLRQSKHEWDETRAGLRQRIGEAFSSVMVGGAAIDPLWTELCSLAGLRLDVGYGLTEASPVVCIGLAGECPAGSVGKPVPGVEVRADARGEILVRGQNVMKGYFFDAESTREAIRENWLHTGDIGHLDEEGNVYIKGRVKEAMVTADGETVYPEDMEPYYWDVRFSEYCVAPLAGPDGNDVPVLVVVSSDPAATEDDLQDVFKALRNEAPVRYRVSRCIRVDESLPRTRLGKIRRRALAATLSTAGA